MLVLYVQGYFLLLLAIQVVFCDDTINTQHQINSTQNDTITEVKIGFLVGSKRSQYDQSYSSPGKHLVPVFNYGIDKINQMYSAQGLAFSPIIAETSGNESLSIKQTINLINKQNVNFIVGPQETCLIESQLASIFDIAMISHYCSPQLKPIGSELHLEDSNDEENWQRSMIQAGTFIQIKPPHWKIVERVMILIERLLLIDLSYPQRLVLLYFKGSATFQRDKANLKQSSGLHHANSKPNELTKAAMDTIQYKMIGELLEIKLNELLASLNQLKQTPSSAEQIKQNSTGRARSKRQQPPRRRSLAVLNWHTTFHYGYTKNPFRQLVRRHLFASGQEQGAANQSAANNTDARQRQQQQCRPLTNGSSRSAIYIVVGHYYEHLGLMLALNELSLLGGADRHHLKEDDNLDELLAESQSSVSMINSPAGTRQQSVVIGVDIEQYDERDDSIRFLRGLLMDESGTNLNQHEHSSDASLGAIANMYRSYIGVVPSRPVKATELTQEMRSYLDKSGPTRPSKSENIVNSTREDKNDTGGGQTIDSLKFMTRLLQFVRLPVEAFYLQESIMLVGAYFNQCVAINNRTLHECSEGRRAMEWFKNREYPSLITGNLRRLDSEARADGSFTLIGRKVRSSNDSLENDMDFGLELIGHFAGDQSGPLSMEFDVSADELDSVWIPLWCSSMKRQPMDARCSTISISASLDNCELQTRTFHHWLHSAISLLFLVAIAATGSWFYEIDWVKFRVIRRSRNVNVNREWFDGDDERNFLTMAQRLLISIESMQSSVGCESWFEKSVEQIHCLMFPFPSCKFVHWLTALHQLRESMFQYQANCKLDLVAKNNQTGSVYAKMEKIRLLLVGREKTKPLKAQNDVADLKGFFGTKHSGTASLRLLLGKYKLMNQKFCSLHDLNHPNIVKLYGVMLNFDCERQEKSTQLVVEQPCRGNLRHAYKTILENLEINNSGDAQSFRRLAVRKFISELLGGLEYLHSAPDLQYHGKLEVTNCLLSGSMTLKLSGFHEHHMRRSLGDYEQKCLVSDERLSNLIYFAPEILENHTRLNRLGCVTMKLADIYSLAFIIYELLVEREPWSCLTSVTSGKLLIDRVKIDSSFRPPLSELNDCRIVLGSEEKTLLQNVLRSCWSHTVSNRPDRIETLRERLKKSLQPRSEAGLPVNNNKLLDDYTKLLEIKACERRANLLREREISLALQNRFVPESIIEKIKSKQQVPNEQFDRICVCSFKATFPGEQWQQQLFEQLNDFISQLDYLVATYHTRIQLVESHINATALRFMVYSGEPLTIGEQGNTNDTFSSQPSQLIASFSLQLIDLINRLKLKLKHSSGISVRCALHCGPVHGGLLQINKQRHDELNLAKNIKRAQLTRYILVGPTIELAELLLEQTRKPQQIQMSADFRNHLLEVVRQSERAISGANRQSNQSYVIIKREGRVQVRHFGDIEAYWLLNGPRLSASQSLMLPRTSRGEPH